MQHQNFNGDIQTRNSVPYPMADGIQKFYGQDFQHVILSWWIEDHILTLDEKIISKKGLFMSEGAPDFLSLKMIKGSHGNLNDPNSILLSEAAAKALFGETDPINKSMRIDNMMDVKVIGVYSNLPNNSEFREMYFLAPWKLFESTRPWIQQARDENVWDNSSFALYVELTDHADMQAISKKIKNARPHVQPTSKASQRVCSV